MNRTREIFDWDTEDDLDGLLQPDHGSHPEFANYFQGVLLEEDIPGSVTAVETKILDPNTIAAATSGNSCITNTTEVYDDSDATTPFLKST